MTNETPPRDDRFASDPNATGATEPLPPSGPGTPGRETHERTAAFARAAARGAEPAYTLCAPDVPELKPELLFTLLAESVRDYAIFLLDANGIIRCWGEGARLMKWWTRNEAEGAHLRMLYPDGGSEDGTAESHLQSAAETGEYNGEGHRTRSDGSRFWAYVTLTALRDPQGRLAGFAKVTRDFSARRAVEAALRRQERDLAKARRLAEEATRLKTLVASVSHELRAPLNAMLGSVALVERAGRERDQAHLDRLQRTGRHLLDIINDVLEMSRAASGSLSVARSVRRLGAAIHEALADVEGEAAARGVTLVNAVSGTAADLPYFGDENRVRQIVVNLLSNAVKFTGRGGQITISGGTGESVTGAVLTGEGPWVYVRVEDTGRGIPPEFLDRIFEPYQQADDADEHYGTGLGLAISRQFARLMGGDVTVKSEIGRGSTFTLWLPIAPSEPIPR